MTLGSRRPGFLHTFQKPPGKGERKKLPKRLGNEKPLCPLARILVQVSGKAPSIENDCGCAGLLTCLQAGGKGRRGSEEKKLMKGLSVVFENHKKKEK